MKCSDEYIEYMHEYLDNDISAEHERKLRHHLLSCEDCQTYFHELKRAIMFVKGSKDVTLPDNFTANVMARLPKERRKVSVKRWFKSHPLLTAASLFLVLMSGSFFSSWGEDHQFSFSKQPELVVENDTVIVPEGKTIKGDVVVRNGDIKIEGTVEGNVTVINGQKYLASAGQVSGEIEEVDEMFEWLWYNIKTTSKDIGRFFTEQFSGSD